MRRGGCVRPLRAPPRRLPQLDSAGVKWVLRFGLGSPPRYHSRYDGRRATAVRLGQGSEFSFAGERDVQTGRPRRLQQELGASVVSPCRGLPTRYSGWRGTRPPARCRSVVPVAVARGRRLTAGRSSGFFIHEADVCSFGGSGTPLDNISREGCETTQNQIKSTARKGEVTPSSPSTAVEAFARRTEKLIAASGREKDEDIITDMRPLHANSVRSRR